MRTNLHALSITIYESPHSDVIFVPLLVRDFIIYIIRNICSLLYIFPRRKSGTRQQTAGWNDIVKESHEVARSDFKFWCSHGKPGMDMCMRQCAEVDLISNMR